MLPNVGQHTMKSGKVIKPGMIIKCSAFELSGAIDKFELHSGENAKLHADIPNGNQVKSTIRIVHKGAGKYNVVKPDGKAINTSLLTLSEAQSLLNGISDAKPENEAD
jgi:hypothetical protein